MPPLEPPYLPYHLPCICLVCPHGGCPEWPAHHTHNFADVCSYPYLVKYSRQHKKCRLDPHWVFGRYHPVVCIEKCCLHRQTSMYLHHPPLAVIYLLGCHIQMLVWIQVENKCCSICISHIISEMLSIIKIIYCTTPIDYIYYHKQIFSCVCMLLLVHVRVIKENRHIAYYQFNGISS